MKTAAAIVLLLAIASPALAQTDEPVKGIVGDVRGSFVRLGQNPGIAQDLGVAVTTLPSRGLGINVGAHVYVFRFRAITFGLGGELLASRGRRSPSESAPAGTPEITTTFSSIAPQLSFNFGTARGWSYLSGGIGTTRFEPEVEGRVAREVGSAKTINYGGGARWFAKPHLAFTVDLRFYAVSPTIATATSAGRPRMTLMVISAGISVK